MRYWLISYSVPSNYSNQCYIQTYPQEQPSAWNVVWVFEWDKHIFLPWLVILEYCIQSPLQHKVSPWSTVVLPIPIEPRAISLLGYWIPWYKRAGYIFLYFWGWIYFLENIRFPVSQVLYAHSNHGFIIGYEVWSYIIDKSQIFLPQVQISAQQS